jgi:hypothetical protein
MAKVSGSVRMIAIVIVKPGIAAATIPAMTPSVIVKSVIGVTSAPAPAMKASSIDDL